MYGRIKCIAGLKREKRYRIVLCIEGNMKIITTSEYGRVTGNLFFWMYTLNHRNRKKREK